MKLDISEQTINHTYPCGCKIFTYYSEQKNTWIVESFNYCIKHSRLYQNLIAEHKQWLNTKIIELENGIVRKSSS